MYIRGNLGELHESKYSISGEAGPGLSSAIRWVNVQEVLVPVPGHNLLSCWQKWLSVLGAAAYTSFEPVAIIFKRGLPEWTTCYSVDAILECVLRSGDLFSVDVRAI